mgnify:CR=1 FL=1
MGLADYLRTNNGLKTTQSVLNKQQSGVDAVHKASPEQINMNTAQAMLHGKEERLAPPKDAHEQAVRMNQQTAEGMLNGSIPIVKKEEPKPETKLEPEKKQLTYAEMYKMLNPADSESPEQRAQREKNEKRKARIAALGDGLRALANIYFASKGAKVVHNPESDMTAAINKRKAYMDAQREKNRAAWQAGYQRALALDEEARKNNLTLAEQMRYHDIIAKNNDSKNDLSQQRIDQGNRRLDLSKLKYTNDAEYKEAKLRISELLANGQISHWAAQDATARLRESRIASKAQASSGGNKTTAGYWYEFYDMMDTPEGQKKINELKRKLRIKNVTQTNVRYIMDRLKGRSSSAGGGVPSGGGKHTTHKAGGSSSAGGKKKTGVKR